MERKAYGFTIIELLIVIIVIAILATISIVAYNGIQNSAAEVALKSDLRNAATQLGIAYAESGVYPDSDAALAKSAGTRYQYDSDGATYCLSATSNRSGVNDWHISSSSGLAEGVCSGHIAGLGGPGGSHVPERGGFTNITQSMVGVNIVVDVGSISTGSWMVVVFAHNHSGNPVPPAGWTLLGTCNNGTGTLRTCLYGKIKQAGDAAQQLFSNTGVNTSSGVLVWGSGGGAVNTWTVGSFSDRNPHGTSTTTVTQPLTTTTANSLVLSIATERTAASEANYTSLTGVTPWVWIPQPNSDRIQTIAIGYDEQAAVGAAKSMTVTYPNAQANNSTAIQIAIPPAE